ncbi:hypothetical protein P3S68_015009 [Capsicum galapagoense]
MYPNQSPINFAGHFEPFSPEQLKQLSGVLLRWIPVEIGVILSSLLGILVWITEKIRNITLRRRARQVYVGGLPLTENEQSVATYFNHVMSVIGGNTAGIYFTYVEMRFVEEASNAMALDGIIFEGTQVIKVRRPTGYNPSLAATLGPSQPNPNLNLAAAGVLYPGSTGDGLEGHDYIFVGGLPYYFTEAQIRELLESFGPLRGV